MSPTGKDDPFQPASLVRTEAAALDALAARLMGRWPRPSPTPSTCPPLRRAKRPRGGHRHGQERHHRAENRRHAQLHRLAGAVSASRGGGARRPGRADARRRRHRALGQRRDRGDSAPAGHGQAQRRRAHQLLLQSALDPRRRPATWRSIAAWSAKPAG